MSSPLPAFLAALSTPIDALGRVDFETFDRIVDFVMDRGAEGIVLGGLTAEFPHFNVEQRAALIRRAAQRMAGRGSLVANVGTSSVFSTVELAREAADAGCAALLLSMPHFFRYSQDDLAAYCETVCASVPAPFLLYHLPTFASPLEITTMLRLFDAVPNLIGIKDSSGEAANLPPLASARERRNLTLLTGYDTLLLEALRAGWHGTVSGVACFAPEIVAEVVRCHREGDSAAADKNQVKLNELVEKTLAPLPTAWGIRLGLEARGIATGPLHLTLSPARQGQVDDIREWLAAWAAREAAESFA